VFSGGLILLPSSLGLDSYTSFLSLCFVLKPLSSVLYHSFHCLRLGHQAVKFSVFIFVSCLPHDPLSRAVNKSHSRHTICQIYRLSMPQPRGALCFPVVRLSVCASVCLFVNTYFAWHDKLISSLSGAISMKLATNVRHVTGLCWQDFQGQRSKVKAMNSQDQLTYIHSIVWRRGWLVLCVIPCSRLLLSATLSRMSSFGTFCVQLILTFFLYLHLEGFSFLHVCFS